MNILKKTIFKFGLAAVLMNATLASAASLELKQINTAKVGSTFTVQVWAKDLFNGLKANAEFTNFAFDIDNTTPGLFSFNKFTIDSVFIDSSGFGYNAAGIVFPGIENKPANQSILLGTLKFNALKAGNANFGIHNNEGFVFYDNDEGLTKKLTMNADLNIKVSAVPVPAALPLFLSGVALFGAVRRKKTV